MAVSSVSSLSLSIHYTIIPSVNTQDLSRTPRTGLNARRASERVALQFTRKKNEDISSAPGKKNIAYGVVSCRAAVGEGEDNNAVRVFRGGEERENEKNEEGLEPDRSYHRADIEFRADIIRLARLSSSRCQSARRYGNKSHALRGIDRGAETRGSSAE